MKKILFVILLSIASTMLGQVREELNYYPLHVGDIWQYKIKYFPETGKDTIFYLTKSVKRDTVLSNGKKYFIVEQPPFTWQKFNKSEIAYLRIDSVKGSVKRFYPNNNIEVQTDSLFCNNGDKFNDVFFSTISETQALGEVRKTMIIIAEISSNGGAFWKLGMNLGLFSAEKYFANVTAEGNKYDLVYAKINGKEYGTYVSVEDEETVPSKFSLSQNYPNPFNPETTISYKVHAASKVSLKVYDLLGREVLILVNEFKQPGNYKVRFNVETRHGVSLQSGVYFYRLQAGSFSETKKMILLK